MRVYQILCINHVKRHRGRIRVTVGWATKIHSGCNVETNTENECKQNDLIPTKCTVTYTKSREETVRYISNLNPTLLTQAQTDFYLTLHFCVLTGYHIP